MLRKKRFSSFFFKPQPWENLIPPLTHTRWKLNVWWGPYYYHWQRISLSRERRASIGKHMLCCALSEFCCGSRRDSDNGCYQTCRERNLSIDIRSLVGWLRALKVTGPILFWKVRFSSACQRRKVRACQAFIVLFFQLSESIALGVCWNRVMGLAASHLTRHMRRFNVIDRTERIISKQKPVRAPLHKVDAERLKDLLESNFTDSHRYVQTYTIEILRVSDFRWSSD